MAPLKNSLECINWNVNLVTKIVIKKNTKIS